MEEVDDLQTAAGVAQNLPHNLNHYDANTPNRQAGSGPISLELQEYNGIGPAELIGLSGNGNRFFSIENVLDFPTDDRMRDATGHCPASVWAVSASGLKLRFVHDPLHVRIDDRDVRVCPHGKRSLIQAQHPRGGDGHLLDQVHPIKMTGFDERLGIERNGDFQTDQAERRGLKVALLILRPMRCVIGYQAIDRPIHETDDAW